MTRPRLEHEVITPRRAAELLSTSTSNRGIRPNLVNDYAKLMADGRWDNQAGSFLGIDENGDLCTGHHRLSAIIKAGVSLEMPVMYGLKREAVMRWEGKGKPWSLADSLHADDMPNAKAMASIAKLVLMCETTGPGKVPASNNLPHPGLQYEWAIERADRLDWSVRLARQVSVKRLMNVSEAGTFHFLMPDPLKQSAAVYLERVARPDLAVKSIHTLVHERLRKFRDDTGVQVRQHTALAWLLDGFNAKLAGRKRPVFWEMGRRDYPLWPTSTPHTKGQ